MPYGQDVDRLNLSEKVYISGHAPTLVTFYTDAAPTSRIDEVRRSQAGEGLRARVASSPLLAPAYWQGTDLAYPLARDRPGRSQGRDTQRRSERHTPQRRNGATVYAAIRRERCARCVWCGVWCGSQPSWTPGFLNAWPSRMAFRLRRLLPLAGLPPPRGYSDQ